MSDLLQAPERASFVARKTGTKPSRRFKAFLPGPGVGKLSQRKTWRETHHHLGAAAETFAVVVGGDDLELEVGPAHVSEHHGRLDDARVGFDDEAVLALLRGRDDEAVRHLAEIARVPVGGLKSQKGVKFESSSHNNTNTET